MKARQYMLSGAPCRVETVSERVLEDVALETPENEQERSKDRKNIKSNLECNSKKKESYLHHRFDHLYCLQTVMSWPVKTNIQLQYL